jgi:putative peptidoglycan lipid II flippase
MSAAGDMKGFRNTLSFAVRLSMFVCIPAMAGLMVLRVPVVSLLFQHGAFTSKNTVECAAVVLTALAGLWAIAGTRNLAQAFYAMNDTATPVKTAFAAFALNVLCSLFLMGPLGAPGLTLANSISSIFNFAVLSMALSRKIGGWDGTEAAKSAARSLAAAAIMAAAVHPFSTLDLWLEGGRYLVKGGVLASAIALGCVVYAAASWTMGGRELRSLLERFGGKSPGNR